jgi:GxxExxY protein
MNADVAQMNVNLTRNALNDLSYKVIGAAQTVSSTLGYGFLEKVYENALCVELRRRDIAFAQQCPVQVSYKGVVVGDYVPDLLVESAIVVEIKSVLSVEKAHRQQCLNYLRATDLMLALLLNFGTAHLEVGRVVRHF